MTQHPNIPPTDRKAYDNPVFNPIDSPCLSNGYDGGAVLDFLMQLYAYFAVKFGGETKPCFGLITAQQNPKGTLKDYLMSSGPYRVVVYRTNFRARPNAMRLRQRPPSYVGPSMGSWVILWPGATRDRFFRAGNDASALPQPTLPKCRSDRAKAISGRGAWILKSGFRQTRPIQPHRFNPVRLIPP